MSEWLQLAIWPQSMLFAEDSHVRTYRTPGKVEDSQANAADCGASLPALSKSSSRASSSLKTSPRSCDEGWTPLSPTLCDSVTRWKAPESRPQTLGHRTDENGCSLWPTPTATPYGSGQNGNPRDGRDAYKHPKTPSLDTLARNWPTPTVSDAINSRRAGYMIRGNPGTTLNDAADFHHGEETRTPGEPGKSKLVLSPAFVEALMGFPQGWTALPGEVASELLGTRSFRRSRK